jgi:hypothetical protein
MADGNSIPCVELPKVSIPNLTLLGGAELNGFLDFSQGAPTDCKLTFNLMLQLAPLLASMACLLKVLDVIGKLKNFVEAVPSLNPIEIGKAVPELVTAINKLSGCIPGFPQFQIDIVFMIKGMLSLIINFLNCFISQLESIIKFQVSIDLTAAEGNPVLLDTLLCAQSNAKTSMDNLMLSLQPVQPLLSVVTTVASIAQLPISLPKLSDISANQDQAQTITTLKQSIASIKQVIDGLPG